MVAIARLAAVLDVVVGPRHDEEQLGDTLVILLAGKVLILNVLPLPRKPRDNIDRETYNRQV